MLKKSLLYGILISCSFSSLYAAQVIIGNSKNEKTSFTFNLSSHAFYNPLGRFFVGARDAVSNNDFSVAVANRDAGAFIGLTPAKVRLNNVPESKNPLHAAAISMLAMLGARPLVAKKDAPASLFLINEVGQIAVFEAKDIHDAVGRTSKSLLAIGTSAPQVMVELELDASVAAFAAIGNAQGGFDGNGSGIALMFFKKYMDLKKKTPFFAWDIVDAQTGGSQFDNDGKPIAGGNKAFPISKSTPAIAITSPVTSISNAVDLFFDRDLGRLYMALQVTAGAGSQDGARAVVVGSIANGKLMLQPIAPDEAFAANNKIVGGRGALAGISIFKVRTMQTTTYLRYLVVVGGNDPGLGQLQQRVYALPLVDNLQSKGHGTLADVMSTPVTLFSGDAPKAAKAAKVQPQQTCAKPAPHQFLTRVFATPATRPAELYNDDTLAAQVGGGSLLPGPITDITTSNDAIFVSVNTNGNGLEPGMFYSQALFDNEGRVTGWTVWQRAAGTNEKISGFSYDPFKGLFWYIPERISIKAPQLGPLTSTVLRNQWTDGNDPLGLAIGKTFPLLKGGVQGLFEFPLNTPSFSTQIGARLAVTAFTGFNTVSFLQTGIDKDGFFGPWQNLTVALKTDNGTLNHFTKASFLVISGGVLADIGPINSCAVVSDGVYGWFVVGGTGGVAILADKQGRGWSAADGLQSGFIGLTGSMAFHKISTIRNVRKIIAQDNKVFILTDQTLERLTISAQAIVSKNLSPVAISQLSPEQMSSSNSYSDAIVSGPLALLATSFGLFRSGNNVDVSTVTMPISLLPVILPESAGSFTAQGPVSRLFAVSSTGFETDVGHGGFVFALNAYVGLSQAQIYRFAIALEQRADMRTLGVVTDQTVLPFPDFFIQNVPTFFTNLGDYRNYVVTDGALIAVSRSAVFCACKPLLELLPPTLKSGQASGSRGRVPFLTFTDQAFSIGKQLRSSASGAWMVPGDFGVRVQQ